MTAINWAIQAITGSITAADFNPQSLTGTGTISGSNYTITIQVRKDSGFKEGTEVFRVAITPSNSEGNGTTVNTPNLTILDTSFSQLTKGSTGVIQLFKGSDAVVAAFKDNTDVFKDE